jgi:hypothetical protein
MGEPAVGDVDAVSLDPIAGQAVVVVEPLDEHYQDIDQPTLGRGEISNRDPLPGTFRGRDYATRLKLTYYLKCYIQ